MNQNTFLAIVLAVAVALFASVAIADACNGNLVWDMEYAQTTIYCFRWYYFTDRDTAETINTMIRDCYDWIGSGKEWAE